MASEAEVIGLVDRGLFRAAARTIDADRAPSLSLQVIRADLEIDVGKTDRARELAEFLLNERLSHAERAKCWEVIGRVALNFGQIERGVRAMHRAAASVALSQDRLREARLIAANCEALLHWVGIEPAAAELPRLRQTAVACGDAYSLISFHRLAAEIKAKKGFFLSAKRSLETAKGLLGRWPSVWHQGHIAIAHCAIHILEADYRSALSTADEALDCASKSGSRRLLVPGLANLAHIKMTLGDLAAADEAISQFLRIVEPGGNMEIAGLDTCVRIALATGDVELSSRLAGTVNEVSARLEDGASYHGLWYLLTRIRGLYQSGDVHAGLTLALEALPRVQKTADENLFVRLKLVAAEGLGLAGKALDGANLLCEAVGTNNFSLEIVGEALRVAARLRSADDPAGALANYDRAVRIFDSVGNALARNDTAREANQVTSHLGPSIEITTTADDYVAGTLGTAHLALHSSALLTEQIAALMEFATVPALLARESFSLIRDTGLAIRATLIATESNGRVEAIAGFPDGQPCGETKDSAVVRLSVGNQGGRDYEICVVPSPTASARTTLLSIERLISSAKALSRGREMEREHSALWPEQTPERQLGLICVSERMLELVETIRRIAASPVNVLLTGETGVGKELFARALHQASPRSDRTFLPFNCATVPRDLFDSQLFGHKRGSFTGALNDSAGVIRAAAGGTLFLDEIGEMTLETQPKLLRFLESGEILPLGETKPQFVDVRIVAATNAKLDQHVADGRFREDLYYRLNVIRIEIPPLRERREEIPALVEHFLEKFGSELQKPMLRVADETLEYLVLYAWPGNVRQLANEIRRLVAMAEPGAVLMPAHLSEDIAASRRTISAETGPRKATEVVTRIDQSLAAAVEHIERAAIQRAIAVCEGRLDEAAKMLGLSRKGLYLKRQRLRLD